MLVGLVSVIYGLVLPDVHTSSVRLFLGISLFVVINAVLSLAVSRRSRGVDSAILAFGVRVVANVVFVLLAGWLLGRGGDSLSIGATLFFICLLSLLTLLDDRYRPVADFRFADTGSAGGRRSGSAAPGDLERPADR
jgi:hypothetical protein